jgi:transcriptional regulator with XRE-family HTH domain
MTTLQEIKKSQRLTNKDIGDAMGVSASTAGMMMQGRHIRTMNDRDIARLASALGVTFERCWLAMEQSYNAWAEIPMDTKHERASEVAHQVNAEVFPEPRNTSIDSVLVVAEPYRINR